MATRVTTSEDSRACFSSTPRRSKWFVQAQPRFFTFLDEHPDSIDDGFFALEPTIAKRWAFGTPPNVPANYHNGAAAWPLWDGHAEVHKWRDAATLQKRLPASGGNYAAPIDVPWAQLRATATNRQWPVSPLKSLSLDVDTATEMGGLPYSTLS